MKQVTITRMAIEVAIDKDGKPTHLLPFQRATLSCGHTTGRLSIVWSVNDPFWCEQCESDAGAAPKGG